MTIVSTTFDPTKKGSLIVLSDDNLTATITGSGSTVYGVVATNSIPNLKLYCEVKIQTVSFFGIGISNGTVLSGNDYGATSRLVKQDGAKLTGTTISAYTSSFTTGDTVSLLIDMENGTLEYWKNGISLGIAFTDLKTLGTIYLHVGGQNTTLTANFGASPFNYKVPTGYYSYDGSQHNHKYLITTEDNKNYSILSDVLETSVATPKMTSSIAPQGKVIFSSENPPNFMAWKAFDQLNDSYYVSADRSGGVGYLGFSFENPKIIYKYSIKSMSSASHLNRMPKKWTFEGSNDGTVWTVLDNQENQTWTSVNSDKSFIIPNRNYFKIYRVNWTQNNGYSLYSGMNELGLYEMLLGGLIMFPDQAESSYIKYGMEKNTGLEMNIGLRVKNFINNNSNVIGSGKVFRQTFNLTDASIKKATIT